MSSAVKALALTALLRLAAVAVVGLTAVRLGSRRVTWLSAPLTAFTLYLLPSAALLATIAAVRRRRVAAITLAACAAVLAGVISPRARRAAQPAPTPGGRRLTIMSANVLKGRAEPRELVALVRHHQPDVLAIQEQHPKYMRELRRAGLFELLPHAVVGGGGRLQDAGVISRFPLEPVPADLPSVYVAALVALPAGPPLPIISAHPLPPMPKSSEALWVGWLARLPSPQGPFAGALVAGDFNATLDHVDFRRVLARGWRDAASLMGQGLRPTWRGLPPLGFLRLTIDHVLVPPGAVVERYCVDALAGSDHAVITVTLVLPA